ncbi:MAG: hypothetical protein II956_06545 [Bacteroidales bacterium]|nr:hypothetical protein [Bacteroidales bacterium]
MVKKLLFVVMSLFCTPVFGQSKCWCDSVYTYYDKLFSECLIFLWDSPPKFKEFNDVHKIRILITRYNCGLEMIIDTLDSPKCIRFFLSEIDSVTAENIVSEIKNCKFSAALVKDKKKTAPLGLAPFSPTIFDGKRAFYEQLPKPLVKNVQKFIKKKLQYPDTQIESGYVLIYILLDDNGNHIGYEMPKYSDSVFCDEVLRVAKLIPFQSPPQNSGESFGNFYPICIKFDKRKARK